MNEPNWSRFRVHQVSGDDAVEFRQVAMKNENMWYNKRVTVDVT